MPEEIQENQGQQLSIDDLLKIIGEQEVTIRILRQAINELQANAEEQAEEKPKK